MGNEDVTMNRNNRLKEGIGMAKKDRRIYFMEDEKLRGWNYVDLGEFGDFYGEYVLPEKHTIYGYWYPTKWTIRRSKDPVMQNLSIKDAPFWASLKYMPEIEQEEEEIKQDEHAIASDFLAFKWSDWILRLEKKEEEAAYEERVIAFDDYERIRGKNKIDLGESGDFIVEYIAPADRKIFGYWEPSEEEMERMREEGKIAEDCESPFWAVLDYIPYERGEDIERELLRDKGATASDFLELSWEYWDIDISNQKVDEKGGKRNEQ